MSQTYSMIYKLDVNEDEFDFDSNIEAALESAELELECIDEKTIETKNTIKKLTLECDRLDYVLAASSGALCGIVDIFLVGKPGESPVGNISDKWFENRTKDFAKLCGWDKAKDDSTSAAIKFLEKKFKIPYDQRGAGDIASWILNLTPTNHHFKSLGHNPTLLGLFFSILDQFTNTSHFVSEGELISIQKADDSFELRGNNIPSKLFCGFVNWFGHLISDISGSAGSKGRGMGIPSPIWSWTNDIIAIKRTLKIPVTEFDKTVNELALRIYKEGYDARFQVTQAIPVIVNELIVRLIYSIRRVVLYFTKFEKTERSFKLLWETCEPFSNVTVKRMLTVAHGTFCLLDLGDAIARGFITGGGSFNVSEFIMRLNIVGVGRFSISLYGEIKRENQLKYNKEEVYFLHRERIVVNDYIEGLNILANKYNDKNILTFISDLKSSDSYIQAFKKSVELAELREVPEKQILKNKSDIDSYFTGGKS